MRLFMSRLDKNTNGEGALDWFGASDVADRAQSAP